MVVELTGQEVLMGILGLALLLVSGISIYRWYHNRKGVHAINQFKYQKGIAISDRTKYPQKNILKHRPRTLGIGLACSLLFTLFAMSWTVYQRDVPILDGFIIEDDKMEVMPRTMHEPPPPPPPPPPPVEKEIVIDDDILEDDDIEDVSTEIDDYVEIVLPEPPVKVVAPPPPPPPTVEDEPSDIPFRVVEKYPYFSGCKDKTCSDQAFLKYVYSRIKYPALARENGIEGRVTARFVIERDGKMSDIQILRGVGAGCDKEVLDVLEGMNDGGPFWSPGEQRGKPVRVLFTLPVTFALNK